MKELLERIPRKYRVGSLEHPPGFLPATAVRTASDWLASDECRLSILGPDTASGKSSLAACVMRSAIERRGIAARWVHASDLVPDHEDRAAANAAIEAVREAPLVVVDGIGKEFGGERPESFSVEVHKRWMMRLFTRIHESDKQRFVLTFDIDGPAIVAYYDASVARRVAPKDPKTVITLRRTSDLELAEMPTRRAR